MKLTVRKANLLLLLSAAIWGFAFVAQRLGMAHVGPFTFNAVRFALGAAVLLPVLALTGRRRAAMATEGPKPGAAATLAAVKLFRLVGRPLQYVRQVVQVRGHQQMPVGDGQRGGGIAAATAQAGTHRNILFDMNGQAGNWRGVVREGRLQKPSGSAGCSPMTPERRQISRVERA